MSTEIAFRPPRTLHPIIDSSWPEMFINPHDGSHMRLVPGAEFIMGSTLEEAPDAVRLERDKVDFALIHETPQFRIFCPVILQAGFAR